MMRPPLFPLLLVPLLAAACTDGRSSATAGASAAGTGITGAGTTGQAATAGQDSDGDSDGVRFDVGQGTGGGDCSEGGNCPECTVPDHQPCDDGNDFIAAIGLNCPGEPQVQVEMPVPRHPGAIGVRSSFGTNGAFAPREGQKYTVIGSGLLADLDNVTPDSDALAGHAGPTHCNDDLGPEYDQGTSLPPPLKTNDVGAVTCDEDPNLIGTGDCSNTIQGQFSQGNSANDYTEIRFTAVVPDTVTSFSYDFAFFSTEYPFYYGSAFNDMYVGWLESEVWTGNISFDEMGNPISLNAGFLDYRDDTGTLPELAGTCMRYHAGTKWLSTTAAVVPGEQITVVFAIFDLSDSILDSYAFIDNFQWGCEGDSKPSTKPVG